MCDTGPLVAAVARRDRHHRLCAELIESSRETAVLVVPVTVTVEVDYLLRSRGGTSAARRFLADVEAGAFQNEPVADDVLSRAMAIDRKYAQADLGIVDASVVAVAAQLGAEAIMTLDHGHFRLVKENRARLIPEEHELG